MNMIKSSEKSIPLNPIEEHMKNELMSMNSDEE